MFHEIHGVRAYKFMVASAHHTSRQTTYDEKSTQAIQHPKKGTIDLSLQLNGQNKQQWIRRKERKESQSEEHQRHESQVNHSVEQTKNDIERLANKQQEII